MAERVVLQVDFKSKAFQEYAKLESQLVKTRQRISELSRAIKKGEGDHNANAVALGRERLAADRLQAELRELRNSYSGVTKAGLRFRDKMAGAGRSALQAAAGTYLGVAGAVMAIGAALSSAVGIMANFESAQSNLSAILGVSKDQMGALTAQAKELGATTRFTASQVTDAQTELAKLGFTMEQITEVTPGVLALASAAGTDIAEAAKVAASTIRGFGLDVDQTGRVVDVMAKSFSTTSLDMTKFSYAMATVAPVAKNAGVSVERTTALLGTLTDAGLEASTAGTSLRNIFLELSNKGMTWEKAMAQINVATDKNAVALDLFGKKSATAASIVASSAVKVDKLTEALEGSAGAADEMAKKQADNLRGDQLLLTSAWEGFVLSVEDGSGRISTALRGFVQVITDILGYFTVLNEQTDVLGRGIASGKGQAMREEQATENFADALKVIVERRAAEAGWTDKTLASTLAMNELEKSGADRLRVLTKHLVERGEGLDDMKEVMTFINAELKKAEPASLREAQLLLAKTELEKRRHAYLTQMGAKAKKLWEEEAQRRAESEGGGGGGGGGGGLLNPTDEDIARLAERNRELQTLADAMRNVFAIADPGGDLANTQGGGADFTSLLGGDNDEDANVDREEEIRQAQLEAQLEANRMEQEAYENLQRAKLNAAQSFYTALKGLAGDSAEAQVGLMALEKGFAIAEVLIQASRARATAVANAISIPPFLPPGFPNPAFPAAQAALVTQQAAISANTTASIAQIAGQTLAGLLQGFAEGGTVQASPSGVGGEIASGHGAPIRRSNGDNRLITAAVGETLLTPRQRARVEAYTGVRLDRLAGFASGGTVGQRSVSADTSFALAQKAMFDSMNSRPIYTSVTDHQRKYSRVRAVENASTMKARGRRRASR